jgi:hypothetical protein
VIDQPGIYQISMEEYLADPCPAPSLSSSIIHTLLFETAAQARFEHPRLNPDCVEKQDDKFDLGTAAHSLFLEGIDGVLVCPFPDWRTKDARVAKDEARKAGKVPLLVEQYEEVLLMVEAAKDAIAGISELGITDLQKEGSFAEAALIWEEKNTWFRIRPDWMRDFSPAPICLHYKTTSNTPNPAQFTKTIVNLGYDIAAAFYERGIEALTGIKTTQVFMVQSVQAPYLCSFIALDPMFMDMGHKKVEQGISLWRKCLSTGEWPAYPKRLCYVEAPAYALLWQQWAGLSSNGEDL